jgi:hypothetical protein
VCGVGGPPCAALAGRPGECPGLGDGHEPATAAATATATTGLGGDGCDGGSD